MSFLSFDDYLKLGHKIIESNDESRNDILEVLVGSVVDSLNSKICIYSIFVSG